MKKLLASLLVAVALNAHAADIAVLGFAPTFISWALDREATKEEKEQPHATTVASGLGDTCEAALTNAKVRAVENVNGAWIKGDSYVRNGLFSEKITQYHGGVIKSYKILKDDCTHVIIEAQVVPRKNNVMIKNSVDVPREMTQHLDGRRVEYMERQHAIKMLDNREEAIAFETQSIKYENRGGETYVVIKGKVTLQPMWLESYTELQKTAGYFDLDGFYRPLHISVTGYDHGKFVVNATDKFYDDLSIYDWAPFGIVVKPKASDIVEFAVKFNTDKLKNIDKFEVKFI